MENRGHTDSNTTNAHGQVAWVKPFPLPILDLRILSKQARNAICTIVSHYATNTRFDYGPFALGAWSLNHDVYRTLLMCMIMLSLSDCPLPEDGLYLVRGSHFRSYGNMEMRMLIRMALEAAVTQDDSANNFDFPEDRVRSLLSGLGKLWDHLEVGTNSLLKVIRTVITQYGEVDNVGASIITGADWSQVDNWPLDHLTPEVKCNLVGLLLNGTASILRQECGTFVPNDFDLATVLRATLRLAHSADQLCDAVDANSFDYVLSALLSRQDLALVFIDALLQIPLSWIHVFTRRFPDRLATGPDPDYGIDMRAYGMYNYD